MANICPKCGTSNRDGAGFCGGCGAQLGGQSAARPSAQPAAQPAPSPGPPPAAPSPGPVSSTPSYSPPAYQTPPPMPAAAAPQATPPPQHRTPAAMTVVGQAAKTAAQKSWEASKQGMGALSRLVTGGGRAAYTELFKPIAIVEGYVTDRGAPAVVPAPLEGAAFVFVAILIFGWLLLLINEAIIVASILLVAWIGLLALSRLGVRRPYFSRLTLTRLRSLIGDKSKGQVSLVRMTVNNYSTGQPVDVVIIGPQTGPQPTQGHWVRVWGIPEVDRNQVRAWQVEVVEQSGRSLGFLRADRLIPLTVALFWPLTLFTLAILTKMVLISFGGSTPPTS